MSDAQVIPFPTPEPQQTCYACLYYATSETDQGWCVWFNSEVDEDVDGIDCGIYE